MTLPEVPASDETPRDTHLSGSVVRRVIAMVLLIALIASALCLMLIDREKQGAHALDARIAMLENQGNAHIESRRWDDAMIAFQEIEYLAPDRPTSRLGFGRIDIGMAEERSQFIGYWTGEARAALDTGRWDDAEFAARAVLEKFPDQSDAIAVLGDIAGAKHAEVRRNAIAKTTETLGRGEFNAALAAATALAAEHPEDVQIGELVIRARNALDRQQADQARAQALLEKARSRDTGEFDAEALEWLREAALLAPQDQTIATHLEKMAAYTRTIRVPEDIADLEEALAHAREKDRILLAAGTWQGTFVINLPIELQGAGPEETILECPAIAGCALTLGPEAKGTRITGIAFRHIGFDPGPDRYSAALVRGGAVIFSDCHFISASGHGLAAIESAQVEIQRCHFRENGWNGIAATGDGTLVNIADSHCFGNFGHGAEAWNGARILLTRSRLEGNTGNGVHIDTTAADVRIESCDILANREFGIVLTTAAGGRITHNRVHQNQLGGIAIRRAASKPRLLKNEVTSNTGPGMLLDHGLPASNYRENTIQRNTGPPLITQASPTTPEPEKKQPEQTE